MIFKHTPAPWYLPHFAEPEANCQCEYVLTGNMLGAVASVHCSGEGDDWKSNGDNPKFGEAVANAHLISASPELLEAAAALIADIKSRYPDEELKCVYMQNLEAAVTKAMGVS